jgi:hypothetical protein
MRYLLLISIHQTYFIMKNGDIVSWKWGKSTAEGKIVKTYEKPVTKTIKGTKVKREASKAEPAYEIEQDNGSKVLKSESELTLSDPSLKGKA